MIIVQIKQITKPPVHITQSSFVCCVFCVVWLYYTTHFVWCQRHFACFVWFCLLCTKSGGLERIIECIGPRHGAKKELAEHLGIHPNVITNWLNGRNKSYRRYVNEIAAFYGVSVDYLLGNADSKEKQPDSQNENQAVKDELIAFYGDVKDDLTPDDIDDLMVAMRAKAERNKKKKSGV